MKRMVILLIGLFILMAPAAASALDIFPPDWRGGPNTIHAEWDDWTKWTPGSSVVAPDSWQANPGGVYGPLLYSPDIAGVDGGILVLKSDPSYKVVMLDFDNYPDTNLYKRIRVQVTFSNNYTVEVSKVETPSGYQYSWVDVTPSNPQGVPDGFFYKAFDIKITPNPDLEHIYLDFTGSCLLRLDQIVVDTQCVPIPGSMLLLGTGVVGLLVSRRFW